MRPRYRPARATRAHVDQCNHRERRDARGQRGFQKQAHVRQARQQHPARVLARRVHQATGRSTIVVVVVVS